MNNKSPTLKTDLAVERYALVSSPYDHRNLKDVLDPMSSSSSE